MQIAFLGDSLTEGRPGAAYLPLLRERLPRHELLNLGRAGDTVVELLQRVLQRGLDPVDLAFIWIGVNDAVMGTWGAQRLTRIGGDYEQLVRWTAARATRVVCVRPIVLEADGSVWQDQADQLGDIIATFADADDATRTLDLRPSFEAAKAAGGGPFTDDGVHFTDAGAEVVAASFAAVIHEMDGRRTAAPDEGG